MPLLRPFALACLACLLTAAEPTISVVVPAQEPSRPAHFRWDFHSANGQPVQVGRFACGSFWVAPAAGDTAVVFASLRGSPDWDDDLLSVDADPFTERHGLLSGANHYGSHDPSEDLLPKLPQTLTPPPGSCISLVAAMQRNEDKTSKGGTRQIVGEVVDAYCVVTVMSAAPAKGGSDLLRPPITGTDKVFLTWDDFDLSRIPRVDFLDGGDDGWSRTAVRWNHSTEVFSISAEVDTKRHGKQMQKFSEGGRAFRSHLLVPDYAAGTARTYTSDLLRILAADTDLEAAKPALAALLTYGLDLYHARYNQGGSTRYGWSSGAGQSLGTLIPPVFAAALCRDETMAHRLRRMALTNHGPDQAELGPQELRQIHRGVTGVLLWGDGHPISRGSGKMTEQDWRYWADFTSSKCYDAYPGEGNPSQGKKTAADPYGYIDGPANKPGSSYMSVSFGGFRAAAALMLLMPEFRSIVNSDAPIEYVDRVVRHGLWTRPDPVAPPASGDQETARLWWSVEGVKEWGVTWGVRPDDVRFAIENGQGRFPSLHGKTFKGGYEVAALVQHWDRLIATYTGLRFEDHLVAVGETVAPEIRFATGREPELWLFCATPDAVIHYTLDGSEPSAASARYDGRPVAVAADGLVRAIAIGPTGKPSAPREGRVPPPLDTLRPHQR